MGSKGFQSWKGTSQFDTFSAERLFDWHSEKYSKKMLLCVSFSKLVKLTLGEIKTAGNVSLRLSELLQVTINNRKTFVQDARRKIKFELHKEYNSLPKTYI